MKHASLFAFLVACGGATPPASSANVETTSAPAVEVAAPAPDAKSPTPKPVAAEAPRALPTACAPNEGDVCSPGTDFANRVCNFAQPDVALILFSKGSPWTRMYLKGDVDGWNAEGGASARAKLQFDEEVIVLKHREAPKGSTAIVVGASGGYQVMRIDGNCYSLEEGEVTTHHPPRAKHPPIPWRYLTEKTRSALLDNASIKTAYDRRGRECKGASVGEVSLACEQADTALSNGIVDAVKTGFVIPTPDKLP